MTSATVFTQLEADWADLAPTRLPADWRDDPDLVPHRTLADLVGVTERRSDPVASDRVLAALVRRAIDSPPDELAARTVLQMLLPGAKALARRLPWLGDRGECAAAVTACLYERIRTYPYQRRPARIAANLLGDTRQRLLHAPTRGSAPARGSRPLEVSLEGLAEHGVLPEPSPAESSPAEELLALLLWAVSRGHLTRAQARLIGQTRVAGASCEELGAATGLGAHSMRRRRQRAESALRRAASAAECPPEIPPVSGRVPDAACAWRS